jgi:hypothetical protein
MKKITIATDEESYGQAIYVDGILKDCDSSLYANNVADYVDENEPVLIESIMVDLGISDNQFPDSVNDLKLYEIGQNEGDG